MEQGEGEPKLSEIARICVNPDCIYAEFGFQSGSEINLFSDPEQHAQLCALAPGIGQHASECLYWQQSLPKPIPKRQ
jgi:hypothetical protein